MAQIGGPNSSYEKLFKDSIKDLDSAITERTNKIDNILRRAYNKPESSAKYWRGIRADLQVQYDALSKLYTSWSTKNIPMAYKSAVKELFDRLNKSKRIAKQAKKSYTDLITGTKSRQIQSILISDAVSDWNAALLTGKANLDRITRRTQQELVREAIIDKSVAEALETGNLMNNTYIKSINMSNTLASQLNEVATIIDGNKYVIAGARRFKPKYYAEMVARVKFHEAQAQGAILTAENYGTSLVQVSSHNTTTAICVPYEGGIYSIKGEDKRFPPLLTVPPFHVNCLHLLFPMFVSSMELDGTLDKWIAFSNGEINMPPSPANFIPKDKRSIA